MTTLHVVSHTHWDREWYRTFQEFRFRLVELMDRLLDLLDRDPDFRFFTLDGQTVLLDDYLAIRPEQEEHISRLVRAGRLLVGPWYVLPDEFLEGPEAMIRNLLAGRRGCRRFTAEPQPMERIGYIPDPFGHISQLPQIGAGFGLEALCFWRGVGDLPTEFRWQAPDGTELPVLHLRNSYSNGAWLAGPEADLIRDLAKERDALLPHATTSHLLIMQGTDHMEPRADLPARMAAAQAALGTEVVHSTLPAYLSAVRAELGAAGQVALPLARGEQRSPQRSHLLPAVLSARMGIKQRNTRCETLLTRWAEPFSALAEVIAGGPSQRGLLRESWNGLLQNHPHDSICGCSVDQVHREMETRFDWSEQIAELVTTAGLEALAGQIDTQAAGSSPPEVGASDAAAAGPRVVVFNPHPFPRTDRVTVHLPSAPRGPWALADRTGRTVPHRLVAGAEREHYDEWMQPPAFADWLARQAAGQDPSLGQVQVVRLDTFKRDGAGYFEATIRLLAPGEAASGVSAETAALLADLLADAELSAFHVHVMEDTGADVELLAAGVPGLGYAQYRLVPSPAAPTPPSGPEAAPADAIENEFFAVRVDPADGTLTVTDKATGLVLVGVNRFVDGGDRGDEYNYCPPQSNPLVDAPCVPPSIRRLDDGVSTCLEIGLLYCVPAALAEADRSARSGQRVDLPITTRVRLTPGVRRVEFETTAVNRAQDHRLRVHFPTPIAADRTWAEGHFDVVERPVALPQGTESWMEQPVGTQPQLSFVDVSDGQRGVLLANRGLPEVEALLAAEGGVTLALTLLRCVGWLSRGDLTNRVGHAGPALPTPEAQCPGEHTFHYALVPHHGNYLTAYREAHAFCAPLRAVTTPSHPGSLLPEGSLVEVTPSAAVLTAVKPPEEGEGLIVRLYNSAPLPIQARVRLWRPFARADRVRLDEQGERTAGGSPGEPLASAADAVVIPLRSREIATLRFNFNFPSPPGRPSFSADRRSAGQGEGE